MRQVGGKQVGGKQVGGKHVGGEQVGGSHRISGVSGAYLRENLLHQMGDSCECLREYLVHQTK